LVPLLVFPLALLGAFVGGRSPQLGDVILGTALYLFGLGEFTHYFVWKRNMRDARAGTATPLPHRSADSRALPPRV